MRTYEPRFHSTTWKGPLPMESVFLNVVPACLGGIFSQMCLGRMGIQRRRMLDLGLEVTSWTVESSTLTALTMPLVPLVNTGISLSMM